jgi:phosphoribosylaminoimidazole-succinocarboxamide synthase
MDNLLTTNFPDLELLHRGKVRDVYSVSETRLLLIATDRISAFDCIIPTAISRKGEVLTKLSVFWFRFLEKTLDHHLIEVEFDKMPAIVNQYKELRGRCVLVKRTKVFPVECIVRGYLAGSGWKDYQQTGEVCGHVLPSGLLESAKLPHVIFTPATKAATGHDENISELQFENIIGKEHAKTLKSLSMKIYQSASEYALKRGIIIADTKFEFGIDETGEIILIDEVLTPDSSRFWDVKTYEVGKSQASYDKQFVRDYLETLDWNKQPPAPELPENIAKTTAERYFQAYKLLTGGDL